MRRHAPRGPLNAVIAAAESLRDFFESPYRPPVIEVPFEPPPPTPGLQQYEDGVIVAQGDIAIASALQRYSEAGGAASPPAVSTTQLAGRYGATVVVWGIDREPTDMILSVRFPKNRAPKGIVSMLKLSKFVRVVETIPTDHDEWCWMPKV